MYSIREGFKSAPVPQRNQHRGSRCTASDLPWVAVRSLGSAYLASKDELIAASLGSSLKICLTVTGSGCQVDALVHLKFFLGKSPAFLGEHGRKTASRPMERVQEICSEQKAV